MARYYLGQPVSILTTVRDRTGALVNAGTLTLVVKIRNADGTTTVTGTYASPVNDSIGTYHQDIPATDLTSIAHYQYVWTSTGTGAGVSVGDFDVADPDETAVLPLQDAKDQLNIPASNTTSDAEIQSFIATIESALKSYTGGPIVNRTVVERAEMMSNQTVILVRQRPLVSVTSITGATGGVIDISAGLDLDANAGLIRRQLGLPFFGPYFQWLPQVNVTYVAGWGTAVPPAFNTAARIILQHLWQTQRAPSLQGPLAGGADVVLPGFGFAIPNAAAELLDGAQNGMPYMSQAYA